MSETPPFPPFQMPGASPPTQPAEPPKPETAKQKTAREKREAKEAAQKAAAEKQPAKPEPRTRRKRTGAAPAKRAPKFDLQTILRVAATLKEDDMPMFEKMIGMLQEAGKPARDRVLAAVQKVFS